MTIADSLGMAEDKKFLPSDSTDTVVAEETPEDRMLLPIGVLYFEGGLWHTIYLTRDYVKTLLSNIIPGLECYEFIEGRSLAAIRFCEVEGPECNMQFIYDYIARVWRLE